MLILSWMIEHHLADVLLWCLQTTFILSASLKLSLINSIFHSVCLRNCIGFSCSLSENLICMAILSTCTLFDFLKLYSAELYPKLFNLISLCLYVHILCFDVFFHRTNFALTLNSPHGLLQCCFEIGFYCFYYLCNLSFSYFCSILYALLLHCIFFLVFIVYWFVLFRLFVEFILYSFIIFIYLGSNSFKLVCKFRLSQTQDLTTVVTQMSTISYMWTLIPNL